MSLKVANCRSGWSLKQLPQKARRAARIAEEARPEQTNLSRDYTFEGKVEVEVRVPPRRSQPNDC